MFISLGRTTRQRRTHRTAVKSRRAIPLHLEPLEDRIVPSTYVVTNLNDSGAGSLRAAVQSADANPGSTINFAKGLHGTIKLTSGELDLTASVAINGPGADKLAVSGNNASRIFNVSGSSTVANISGLTITDGKAADQAGGILNQDSTLNLSKDVLSNNVTAGSSTNGGRGGAIRNLTGNLNISDSLIAGNQALGGAGQFAFGGGVYDLSGKVTIQYSTISGNLARGADNVGSSGIGDGGGLFNAPTGLFTLTGVLLIGNQAIGGKGGRDWRRRSHHQRRFHSRIEQRLYRQPSHRRQWRSRYRCWRCRGRRDN